MQKREAVVPELLVVGDPFADRAESFGDEVVAALAAVSLFVHESGIEEYAKVLGDGRATHSEVAGDSVDRMVAVQQQIEHPTARGMADCSEDIRLTIGGYDHAANIRK